MAPKRGDVLTLQRAAGNRAVTDLLDWHTAVSGLRGDGLPSIVPSAVERRSGEPLDRGIQRSMEAHFDHDFSDVRVHRDADATQAARSLNAFAYTFGSDVVFDGAHYRPHTADGQRLLGHELTHVVQQQATGPTVQLASKDDDPVKMAEQLEPLDPAAVSGQQHEAAVVGYEIERVIARNWDRELTSKGYTVWHKGHFPDWLAKAFGKGGPDLAAFNQDTRTLLIGDITAGPWSQSEIRTGDPQKLLAEGQLVPEQGYKGNQYRPRDIHDEWKRLGVKEIPFETGKSEERKPHLQKTTEDARRAVQHLPRDMKDVAVIAQDYYHEANGYSIEVPVKSRTGRRGGPTGGGSTPGGASGGGRGPAAGPKQTASAAEESRHVPAADNFLRRASDVGRPPSEALLQRGAGIRSAYEGGALIVHGWQEAILQAQVFVEADKELARKRKEIEALRGEEKWVVVFLVVNEPPRDPMGDIAGFHQDYSTFNSLVIQSGSTLAEAATRGNWLIGQEGNRVPTVYEFRRYKPYGPPQTLHVEVWDSAADEKYVSNQIEWDYVSQKITVELTNPSSRETIRSVITYQAPGLLHERYERIIPAGLSNSRSGEVELKYRKEFGEAHWLGADRRGIEGTYVSGDSSRVLMKIYFAEERR